MGVAGNHQIPFRGCLWKQPLAQEGVGVGWCNFGWSILWLSGKDCSSITLKFRLTDSKTVFRTDFSTRQVYEEGAKEVTLSILSVVNHKKREFIVKFSAIEIYNECDRDLLSTDSTPLKLLDDSEVISLLSNCLILIFQSTYPDLSSYRGITVEKLTEEVLKDCNHVIEPLYVCEAIDKKWLYS